jgi:peptidoglycan/LPS O-acetylase OafA/YrhL
MKLLATSHNESLAIAQAPKRMTLIDGLRGIAALMVVLPHSAGLWDKTATSGYLSASMRLISSYGGLGVEIFFVLSGFAIAYSARKAQATPNWLLNFWLKRLIRLTPPYWISIDIMSLVLLLRFYLGNTKSNILPSINQFFVHLFYGQGLLGYEQLNVVYWTLCIEVQFYMAFALLITGLSFISERWFHGSPHAVTYPFLFTTLISLSRPFQATAADHTKVFTPYWFIFASGVLIWWAIDRKINRQIGWVVVATLWGFASITYEVGTIAAAFTTTLIYLAGILEKLDVWLNFRILQFLGLISYSLYIIHVPISSCMLGIRTRLSDGSDLANLILFVIVLTVCIASSAAFYQLIEVPSINWSRKISLNGQK